MKIIIEKADISDAAEILALQKLAYKSEAEIYGDYSIEPLVQTLEEIERQFEDHIFLKAGYGGTIVGSVRAQCQEGTCRIGKLMVHPEHQNAGIGRQLMTRMESYFLAPLRLELFTGSRSEKNLRFYEKLGYTRFRTVPIHAYLSLVYLEKYID
ncbi:GNAT family N-acetyltransferase [Paenibacillus sp. P26]|nr:GNAT family N-acetyltransferase [Paenibacillus sp. P26]UUZ94087.1 GNAT family N-acetyltransferase [Paenibacillus sp. P25]